MSHDLTLTITKRDLTNLLAHASKDATRQHLYGVHVDLGTGVLAATDGHRLAVYGRSSLVAPFPAPESGSVVSRTSIEQTLKLATSRAPIVFSRDEEGVVIATVQGVLQTLPMARAAGVQFPPFDKVVPGHYGEDLDSSRRGCPVLGIHAAYLSDAGKYCAGDDHHGNVLVQWPRAPLEPVIVRSSDRTRLVVVMPVQV